MAEEGFMDKLVDGLSIGVVRPIVESLWTVKQVAARLAVSVDWVHDHVSRKEPRLPVANFSSERGRGRGVLRFRREDIENFIEQQIERSKSKRVM
jgi:predicted DNA-binding transcriptional regulator AlpA